MPFHTLRSAELKPLPSHSPAADQRYVRLSDLDVGFRYLSSISSILTTETSAPQKMKNFSPKAQLNKPGPVLKSSAPPAPNRGRAGGA